MAVPEIPPRGRVICAATLLAFVSACATLPKVEVRSADPAQKFLPRIASIALAAPAYAPRAELQALAQATPERQAGAGAAHGAGRGIEAWAEGLGNFRCSGSVCGGMAVIYIASLPVFAAVGAIIGSVKAASDAQTPEALRRAEQDMTAALAELGLQEGLQLALSHQVTLARFDRVTKLPLQWGPQTPGDAPAYGAVQADAVLEAAVMAVRLESGGSAAQFRPVLDVDARLLRPGAPAPLDRLAYRWNGPWAPASAWTAEQGQALIDALNHALNEISEDIAYELLLAWYPPREALPAARRSGLVPGYALAPLRPGVERRFDLRGAFADRYRGTFGGMSFGPAESSRPLLEWEAFPRGFDVADPRRITEVVYDLRLYRAVSADPVYVAGPLVYERSRLEEPRHRVEDALAPCERYAWTVRARFKLDGQPRATEWASALGAWSGLAMEPWEIRRGAPSRPMQRERIDPRLLYYPMRVPGTGCD